VDVPPEALVGSPLKKARPSIDQGTSSEKFAATQSLSAALGSVVGGGVSSTTGTSSTPATGNAPAATTNNSTVKVEEEEEL
jgi:hypothetical protein